MAESPAGRWVRVGGWALAAVVLATGCDAAGGAPRATRHAGICDASAGAAIDGSRFVVASDEDQRLRVYDADRPGPALAEIDLASFLEPDGASAEADIEGAAAVGDTVYWVTSHGRTRKGKQSPARRRFFATTLVRGEGRVTVRPAGRAYRDLLDDLLRDERLTALGLPAAAGVEREAAAELAPRRGGVNIEGLAAIPGGGGLYLGFRSPVPGGRALLVPLANPAEVVAGRARPELGSPVLLSLGGLGIRGMEATPSGDAVWIVAGPVGGGDSFALYRWSGARGAAPERLRRLDRLGGSPESVLVGPDGAVRLLLDRGAARVGGRACKSLADPGARHFESLLLDGTAPGPSAAPR